MVEGLLFDFGGAMQKTNVQGRIAFIEGIRGICALVVIFNHFMIGFYPASYWGTPSHNSAGIDTYLAQSPISFFYAGNYAVCIFFVITGFVFAYACFLQKDVTKMLTVRYFRLCVPILVSTLVIYVFLELNLFSSVVTADITGSEWLRSLYSFEPDFSEVLVSTLSEVLFVGNYKYNTVLWMMPIIFYGAFLTVLVATVWGKLQGRYLIYVIIMYVLSLKTDLYYVSFVLGIICADLYVNVKEKVKKVFEKISVLLIVIGVYLGGYPMGVLPTNIFYSWLNVGEYSFQYWHILGAFLLLVGVVFASKLQRVLEKKLFVKLGQISFSICLTHIIVLCSFSCKLFTYMWSKTGNYHFSFVGTLIPSIVLIFSVAYVLHVCIEVPMGRIAGKCYEKFIGNNFHL